MIDSFTEEGAIQLAKKINAYWIKRGLDPIAHAVDLKTGYIPKLRTAGVYGVRSTMRNGYPTKRVSISVVR